MGAGRQPVGDGMQRRDHRSPRHTPVLKGTTSSPVHHVVATGAMRRPQRDRDVVERAYELGDPAAPRRRTCRQDWNRRPPALSAEADDYVADRTIVNAGARGHGRTMLLAETRARFPTCKIARLPSKCRLGCSGAGTLVCSSGAWSTTSAAWPRDLSAEATCGKSGRERHDRAHSRQH